MLRETNLWVGEQMQLNANEVHQMLQAAEAGPPSSTTPQGGQGAKPAL